MIDHADRLNGWHLELAIVADAVGHVLAGIEEPEGLSATAYVLRTRLAELVAACPFPDDPPLTIRASSDPDFDLDQFGDGHGKGEYASLADDLAGVPAELLTGGRDD